VRVPIVPAAVLFDLFVGDGTIRPDAELGYAACEAASSAPPLQGNAGAGLGATVGKLHGLARAMKGGIGTASLSLGHFTVGALVAVNAIGDVLDPAGGVIAGARTANGLDFARSDAAWLAAGGASQVSAGMATTIGVVATDAQLNKAQATQLASLAHHGISRAISPLTLNDGDTLFALATGARGDGGDTVDLSALGALAAEVVSRAIRNAVQAARSIDLPDGTRLLAASDLAAQ
jgi:L-aminopeptidase/D-esterase-like protein